LNIGIEAGILGQRTFSILVVMCLFTTFMTFPLVRWIYYDAMCAAKRAKDGHPPPPSTSSEADIEMNNNNHHMVQEEAVNEIIVRVSSSESEEEAKEAETKAYYASYVTEEKEKEMIEREDGNT